MSRLIVPRRQLVMPRRQRGFIINPFAFGGGGPPPAGNFADEVAADSPFIWYRLGETSGTAIADSSGSSRNATLFGSAGTGYDLGEPSLVNDANGAIELKANTAYVRSNSTYTASLTNVTLMVAIKINSGAGAGYIAGWHSLTDPTGTGGSRDKLLYINSSGQVAAYVFNGSQRIITSPAAVNDGVRRLVHFAMGTTDSKLFIDGVEVASMSFVSAASYVAYLYAGMNNVSGLAGGANAGMRGVIDEVAWFPSRLSDARILKHAQEAGLA